MREREREIFLQNYYGFTRNFHLVFALNRRSDSLYRLELLFLTARDLFSFLTLHTYSH